MGEKRNEELKHLLCKKWAMLDKRGSPEKNIYKGERSPHAGTNKDTFLQNCNESKAYEHQQEKNLRDKITYPGTLKVFAEGNAMIYELTRLTI